MTTDNKTNRPILTLSGIKNDKEVIAHVAPANKTNPDSTKLNEQHPIEKQDQANKALKYKEVLQYLQKEYPIAFPAKPVLLSIKIHEQLFEQQISSFSKSAIRNFLQAYTRTYQYNKTKRSDTTRYNLDGSVSTVIHHSKDMKHLDNLQ